METECHGLMGKFFGHSFKQFLVKEKFNMFPCHTFELKGKDGIEKYLESQRNIYIVICKRCGMEKNDGINK